MRLTVILNSTRDDAPVIAGQIADACQTAAVELQTRICDGLSLATAARQALAAGSTVVAAGGGDGTISTVASVLAGTDTALGVLPLGTLNHFARDLGIPHDINKAIGTIVSGRTVQVDVGDVNGRLFINNSSVGLYPRLVWEREQRQRQGHRKLAAMVAAAATVWRRYRRVTVLVQAEGGSATRVRTPFVFVGNNAYQLSGLNFGSRSRLDSGRLQVCMAPELAASGVMRVLGAVLVGRLTDFDQFESLDVAEFTIGARRARLGVALDGEVTVLAAPLRYRIRPAALRVIVPQPTV